MIRTAALVIVMVSAISGIVDAAGERHPMKGVVLSVDRTARTMMVSTQAVPGFMAAMAMSVDVQDASGLEGLKPGTRVEFTYVVDGKTAYADNIHVLGVENLDRKQLELQRLK